MVEAKSWGLIIFSSPRTEGNSFSPESVDCDEVLTLLEEETDRESRLLRPPLCNRSFLTALSAPVASGTIPFDNLIKLLRL